MILGLPWLNWVDLVIRWHERKLFHVRRTKSGDDEACLHEILPLETERPVDGGVPSPRSKNTSSQADVAIVSRDEIWDISEKDRVQYHETVSNIKDLGLIRSCPLYPVPTYRTACSLELPQVYWTLRRFIGTTAGSLDLPRVHWTYRGFIGPTTGSLDLPRVHWTYRRFIRPTTGSLVSAHCSNLSQCG